MKNATSSKSKRPLHMGLVLTLLVTIALILAAWFLLPKPNYAEEVARPFEEALIKAGGVKKTAGGDAGRGFDNTEPYYDAVYELPLKKDEAISFAYNTSQDNGYKLTHASPNNRGNLSSVADVYIDAWYFDVTSKKSHFSDLEQGPISLAIKIGDDSDKPSSPDHTLFRVSIRLPNFKT